MVKALEPIVTNKMMPAQQILRGLGYDADTTSQLKSEQVVHSQPEAEGFVYSASCT